MRFAIGACLMLLVASAHGAPPQLPEVLDRAAAYVADLERRLPALVVEERCNQTAETTRNLGGTTVGVTGGGGAAMQEADTVRTRRQSRSELLLVRRPQAPLVWGAARVVIEIDGKPAGGEAGRLARLAADPVALASQWAALVEASRRPHIGVADRDLRAPLLALALLRADQRDRLAFRKEGDERVRGVAAWKVGFVEQKGPALLVDRGNVPLSSHGTFWIDPVDGKVLRTRIEIGDGKTVEQFRIEVDYAPDAATGVLLPSELRERYQSERGKVDVKATYSGYRILAGP